jgi:hypothetical protein
MLSFAWICVQTTNLLNHTLKVDDVSNNVNLDKILKFDLGYR